MKGDSTNLAGMEQPRGRRIPKVFVSGMINDQYIDRPAGFALTALPWRFCVEMDKHPFGN
jgi:hypothetical protein